jgi:hypothetical protein
VPYFGPIVLDEDVTKIKIITRLWNTWSDIYKLQGLMLHTYSSLISLRQRHWERKRRKENMWKKDRMNKEEWKSK